MRTRSVVGDSASTKLYQPAGSGFRPLARPV
jgi:hypothetical protein